MKNKHIFVINGGAGVGKDTFCSMVASRIPTKVVSSVDKVKIAAQILGWDRSKTFETRKLLSDLKDMSTLYFDGPMKYLRHCVKFFNEDDEHEVLFVHIREPEEIKKFADEFNVKTILIINTNVDVVTSNHADFNVENYDYDCVINNSGSLENLRKIADAFVDGLRGE